MAEGPAPSQERARQPDVRVGSSTNALAPVSVAERSLGAGPWQWAGLAAVVCAAVAGDQLTKHVVTGRLALDESSRVVGPLSIHRVENSGIAFGFFTSATGVVIALTAVAVVWMLVYFARHGARHPVIPAALGLLIGGSVSNLVDRVRLGHVTDFIDFGWWPAFNLADSFIVIGVAILLAALLGADRRPQGRPPPPGRRGPLGPAPQRDCDRWRSRAERSWSFRARPRGRGSTGSWRRSSARGRRRHARSTRERSSTAAPAPRSYRLEGGERVELPEPALAAAAFTAAGGLAGADRLGGRASRGGRQACGSRRPSRCRARDGHARRRARRTGRGR